MKQQAACAGVSPQRAQEALVALLERSIRFRHRRLAVLRLCDAMESGASVPEAQWRYCLEAMPWDDLALRARLAQAARRRVPVPGDAVSRRS